MIGDHVERRRSKLGSLPCASGPALLGEAAMRHKISYVVGVRFPDPVKDTHLSYQSICPLSQLARIKRI